MPFLARLENIDTAIANLNLKEGTLKAQFIAAIREHFSDPDSLRAVSDIPAEVIIQKIWQVNTPQEIKNKRKNLSGLKSSINKSFKKLLKEDKNPDGIIIGRTNTFTIAEEHKDQIIQQLGISPDSIRSMQEMLNSFKTLLTEMGHKNDIDDIKNLVDQLNETQQMLKSVSINDENDGTEELEELDESEFIEVDEEQLAALEGMRNNGNEGEGDGTDELEELDESDFIEVAEEQLAALEEMRNNGDEGEGDGTDELEELDESDFIEVDEEQLAAFQTQGDSGSEGEDDGTDDLEELDESEFIEVDEEQLAALQAQGDSGSEGEDDGTVDLEELNESEFIEVDEEQLAALEEQGGAAGEGDEEEEPEIILDESDFEETEIVEEDELTEIEEVEDHPIKSPEMLEALSKYIDPEEALASNAEYLTESHDEYTAHLLQRFMPKFIKIPADQYFIGSNHPKPIERAQERITLEEFHIGQFPVINDLFEIFVRETGYETSAEKNGYGYVLEGRFASRMDTASGRAILVINNETREHRVAGANWRNPRGPGSSIKGKYKHPVVQISYADARAFAAWAGKRLPTEDEWEVAARGQDNRLFPWGNTWLPQLGNFDLSALGDTTTVDHHGRESSSPFGLYDMLGNVYEWTSSLYLQGNPSAEQKQQIHILKGGCWTSRKSIHVGHRMIEKADYWSNIIGFRCAV